jgi:hypothetical protein
MDVCVAQLSERCFYHCLAVDTKSAAFMPRRFGEPHQAYNYFARTAIVGAIAWCLKDFRAVALKLHSDCKTRLEGDNFEEYIPREVTAAIQEKRRRRPSAYPALRLLADRVVLVDSNPMSVDKTLREECELTQLVDIVTSAIMQALTAASGRTAKLALADLIAAWVVDTRKPPWLQTEELHRRFSVSCFPGSDGGFYNPALPVITRHQMQLFKEDD